MKLTEKFIPLPKNPPAKTKDAGIIALVMSGAGVYNAKANETVFLPEGREALSALVEGVASKLLSEAGFQPLYCADLPAAARSLAERFLRDFKEGALLWSLPCGDSVELFGWNADEDGAERIAENAAAAVKSALSDKLPGLVSITEAKFGRRSSFTVAAESEKGTVGELAAFKCPSCGYFCTMDTKADRVPDEDSSPEKPLEDVHTPGTHTIPLLCEYLNIGKEDTLKAMLYTLILPDGDKKLLFAMIRGDLNISIAKLAVWAEEKFPGAELRRAEETEIIEAFGEVAGFCGPVGVPDNVQMVADISIQNRKNLVVGGNKKDYHKVGCCWGRDFEPPATDLLQWEEGSACPKCGGTLEEAHLRPIFTVETYFSEAEGEKLLSYRDREGTHKFPVSIKGVFSADSALLAVLERKASPEDA